MLVMLGCGAREPAHPEQPAQHGSAQQPISNESKQPQREELVARAEQSLAASLPLDYGRPMNGAPVDRPETVSLLLAACRAGDKPSCWIAWQIEHWQESSDAMTLVRANCLGGDLMSCRALPLDAVASGQNGFPDVPGAAGRTDACWEPRTGPAATCDLATLRRECTEHYPQSCLLVPVHAPSADQDRDTQIAHSLALSREGCRLRISGECNTVIKYGTEQEQQQALERMCPITVGVCDALGQRYLVHGDLLRARELAERACQHWEDPRRRICMNLGENYLKGMFPEPEPGRGKALIAWACENTDIPEVFPKCKPRPAKPQRRPAKSK
jgi:hypothetical protein